MRMRTLPQAAEVLKAEDPGTALTLATLRKLVKQGKIPATSTYRWPLIDVDRIAEYLSMEREEPKPQGGIRAIPE